MSTTIDELAPDFEVYLSDPFGDYRMTGKPILEYEARMWNGSEAYEGWLVTLPTHNPQDYFIVAGREDLPKVLVEARRQVREWIAEAEEDGEDIPVAVLANFPL